MHMCVCVCVFFCALLVSAIDLMCFPGLWLEGSGVIKPFGQKHVLSKIWNAHNIFYD